MCVGLTKYGDNKKNMFQIPLLKEHAAHTEQNSILLPL